MKPKSERKGNVLKNAYGAFKKAIKEALVRGASQAPAGTVHVSKTPKSGGLGG